MLVLSICIPHYNQVESLKENLSMILQAKSNEFEVVVVDNGSAMDIHQELKDIQDPRVRIIQREEPVSGSRNTTECLLYAKGKYAFLCLDKNYVMGQNLDLFIDCLKKHPNLCGGYCRYRYREDDAVKDSKYRFKIYKKRAPLKFWYGPHHPTSLFYRTEIIKKAYPTMLDSEKEHPFSFDILAAECAVRGAMMDYDYPLWYSFKGIKGEEAKSYSYSPKQKNIWFTPENRIKSFNEYCNHLKRLPCSGWMKKAVILQLYVKTLKLATLDYKYFITDLKTCNHYRVQRREFVPKSELRGYVKKLNRSFLESDVIDSRLGRYIMYAAANLLFFRGKGRHLL